MSEIIPTPLKLQNYLAIGNGCWEWRGHINDQGYGVLSLTCAKGRQRPRRAHRLVYEWIVGPVPEGLELDHLCRNRACVRPDHLEPVTHAENLRRSSPHNRWSHCSKGHELSPENRKASNKGTYRCKICSSFLEGERAKRLASEGKCNCGRVLEPEFKTCARCRERALAYWYEKRKEQA